MAIKALMMDVDGVLVDGRPEDRRHWQTSIKQDLGLDPAALHEHFFVPHWEDIVLGRAGLMDPLASTLQKLVPHVNPDRFVSYWFERDAHLVTSLLRELALIRSAGIRVYLATNQEHLRAAYLMRGLGLAKQVDGIFYSAQLGAKKPNADFFAKIQAAFGWAGEEMLLIDDSPQNVEAALKAGWSASLWTRHSQPESLRRLCGFSSSSEEADPKTP